MFKTHKTIDFENLFATSVLLHAYTVYLCFWKLGYSDVPSYFDIPMCDTGHMFNSTTYFLYPSHLKNVLIKLSRLRSLPPDSIS